MTFAAQLKDSTEQHIVTGDESTTTIPPTSTQCPPEILSSEAMRPSTITPTVNSTEVTIDELTTRTIEPQITVGDVNKIIECLRNNTLAPVRLMHLVNRLVPFAKSVPGSSLAFKNERKLLHSRIASPVYEDKPWRWFVTMSNADKYEEYLYRWAFNDGNGGVSDFNDNILSGEEAELFLRQLTKAERTKVLREHPVLATRSFMIKQALIMTYIIIEDSSFGRYHDHWARIEFQRSLSAHIHMLISVYDDEGIGELKIQQGKLSETLAGLLNRTTTAEV